MSQRLVWNFEFATPSTVDFILPEEEAHQESIRWESRFFWPADQIIQLNTIDEGLLDLGNYQQKYKEDYYYLIPDYNFNIKRRRNELLYKPLVKQTTGALGFGPKINLDEVSNIKTQYQADALQVQKTIQQSSERITELLVKKESFTYKFSTHPAIRLELAHLEIKGAIYFSLCIEGKSLSLVENIRQALFDESITSDYVSFLKNKIK